MESCGMNVIKYVLFVFNLIFALSGLGVLVAGAVVLADVGEFSHFLEGRVLAPPVVLIVAGALVFLVASLGCYGAIRESPKLLIAFAVCLGVVFILELAVGIAACALRGDLQDAMQNSLKTSMARYSTSQDDMMAWDNVQRKLMCCGIEGPSDWVDYSSDKKLPPSCCKNTTSVAECHPFYPTTPSLYHQSGCLQELKNKVEMGAAVLIGVGIGIAFIQIAGIVLACWLAAVIRREEVGK